MALSSGSPDFVFLGNGSIATGTTSRGPLAPGDGDLVAQQLLPRDVAPAKVSPNGCLHRSSTVRSSLLPLDSQRAPPAPPQHSHPCPYHQAQSGRPECHTQAGPPAPSALASCCTQPPSEHSAPLCANHSPLCQAARCLLPSPPFCLHQPWPDQLQHQPAQQRAAGLSLRPPRPFKLPKR